VTDDQEIWDAGDVSGYLKMSRPEFMRKGRYIVVKRHVPPVGLVNTPFPPRLEWSTDRHPKWVAGDVKSWATGRGK
jgi:hypothetical protein